MLSQAVTGKSSQLVRFDGPDSGDGSRGSLAGTGKSLFGLDAEALAARMMEVGEPAWRGKQLAEALYRQRVAELSEITTLPKSLRRKLAVEDWQVGRPQIAQVFRSVDGTERYLVESEGKDQAASSVETVWMPEGDDGETGDGSEVDVPESGAETLGAPSLRLFPGARVGNHEPHASLPRASAAPQVPAR